jgi:hypothetical protein
MDQGSERKLVELLQKTPSMDMLPQLASNLNSNPNSNLSCLPVSDSLTFQQIKGVSQTQPLIDK